MDRSGNNDGMLTAGLLTLAHALTLGQTPEHDMKGLDFLLGDWTSKEVMTAGTQTIEFTLQGKNRLALGGQALLIEENFTIRGREMTNLIVIRPDAPTKAYRMDWFSGGQPGPIQMVGKYTGAKTLIFEPLPTEKSPIRIVYELGEPGFYKARLEIKSGDKYEVRTRAEYTRKQ